MYSSKRSPNLSLPPSSSPHFLRTIGPIAKKKNIWPKLYQTLSPHLPFPIPPPGRLSPPRRRAVADSPSPRRSGQPLHAVTRAPPGRLGSRQRHAPRAARASRPRPSTSDAARSSESDEANSSLVPFIPCPAPLLPVDVMSDVAHARYEVMLCFIFAMPLCSSFSFGAS
mgnify:CR=1 FL=1